MRYEVKKVIEFESASEAARYLAKRHSNGPVYKALSEEFPDWTDDDAAREAIRVLARHYKVELTAAPEPTWVGSDGTVHPIRSMPTRYLRNIRPFAGLMRNGSTGAGLYGVIVRELSRRDD